MDISLILVFVLLFLCLLGLSWFSGSDAPFVPTKSSKIRSILKIAGVKKGKIFYELGSGDGRIVIEAGKMGSKAFGIEQSILRVWYSRFKTWKLAFLMECKNIKFYHGNIFDRSYSDGDIIYIYLLQKAVDKLEVKLQDELKGGSVVITQTYHFKTWVPFKKTDDFYIYRTKY